MNKFLITVIIPTIEKEYDVYIPNNKKMGTIKKYLLGVFLTTGAKYEGIDEKDNCITALYYGADEL